MTTTNEYEIAFYKRETGSPMVTIQGLKKAYYDSKVGGTNSVASKELSYLRTKTGLTTGSIADLQRVYWATVIGANKGAGPSARNEYYKNAPGGH